MYRSLLPLITVALFTAAALYAYRSWKRRTSDQENGLNPPLEALDFFGELVVAVDGLYVATTFAQDHLDRITAFGLGHRGFAQIMLFDEGLLVVRKGERPLAIEAAKISSVQAATATIDKAVESGGLIQVNWLNDTNQLSTFLRVADTSDRNLLFSALEKSTDRKVSAK